MNHLFKKALFYYIILLHSPCRSFFYIYILLFISLLLLLSSFYITIALSLSLFHCLYNYYYYYYYHYTLVFWLVPFFSVFYKRIIHIFLIKKLPTIIIFISRLFLLFISCLFTSGKDFLMHVLRHYVHSAHKTSALQRTTF